MTTDALLTATEVAQRLNLRVATVRAWTYRRLLPSVRVGARSVRYRREDVERIIRSGLRPALRPLREAALADTDGGRHE